MKNKCLALDLNGTVIEPKTGVLFSEYETGWKFKKGILPKIREYYEEGYYLFIITNQAGIADGYVRPEEFHHLIADVMNDIEMFCKRDYNYGVYDKKYWDDKVEVFVSDSHTHPGRKPNTHFADIIKEKYNIDWSQSLYVGDASGLIREEKIGSSTVDFSDSVEQIIKENKGKVLPLKTSLDKFVAYCFNIYYFYKDNPEQRKTLLEAFEEKFKIEIKEEGYDIYKLKKDFSDSDKVFAQNVGISYIDIDDFLKP